MSNPKTKWALLLTFIVCVTLILMLRPPDPEVPLEFESNDGSSFLYFAYGSNLLKRRIHFQNPSATFRDAAKLEGYKLEFRLPSQRWQGCAATITESAGEIMYGCLWELDIEHLETLDNQEGVHQGIYDRIKLEVTAVKSNATVYVFTYVGEEERMRSRDEECLPSKAYKSVIIEGAVEHDLPAEYVERLRLIEDNGFDGQVDLGTSS